MYIFLNYLKLYPKDCVSDDRIKDHWSTILNQSSEESVLISDIIWLYKALSVKVPIYLIGGDTSINLVES